MTVTSKEITNYDDMIDSRDVIARIEDLESDVADGIADDDEKAELASLKALEAEAEGYAPDWRYGAQLVRYSYFVDHAQELAEDCGMINDSATWPNNCIDWDEAARQLQQDYTEVDFGGVAYWVR